MKNAYHTLIIGTGCAGYNAADWLYDLGVRDIAILTEGRTMGTSRNTGSDKQTYYKLSLCGSDGDSVREMARTLYDGIGVNGDIALAEAAGSVQGFMKLVNLGVPFPTNEYGEFVGYKTDHDPRSRATSCGPLTSKKMTEALERSVIAKGIEILDGYQVIKLAVDNGRVTGLATIATSSCEIVTFSCENVILATGGPAGIYQRVVYPESQTGASGLALQAGAVAANLCEWQYGLASTKFRWNVSGTYQQVLPRYLSVSPSGQKTEILQDMTDMVFLKGYQWPFDTRKINGSSRVDIIIQQEIKNGNRVFMDFTQNPASLKNGFETLSQEAYQYLERSGALFGTPIQRLAKMNPQAIALYADHGIDLWHDPLEVAICAQHCNGGIDVNANWESSVKGLYVVGEAAGTFGVYRPGGSALNSTQVGSMRAAQAIAVKSRINGENSQKAQRIVDFSLPAISYGESRVKNIRHELQKAMSDYAAFMRNIPELEDLHDRISQLCQHFFETVTVSAPDELPLLYKTYDMAITQQAVLSAMLLSAKQLGTRGSALVSPSLKDEPDTTPVRILTQNGVSFLSPCRPIPDADLWFENVWNQYNKTHL